MRLTEYISIVNLHGVQTKYDLRNGVLAQLGIHTTKHFSAFLNVAALIRSVLKNNKVPVILQNTKRFSAFYVVFPEAFFY